MAVNPQIAGRILKLMSDKKISAYKLCKDLKIHSGLFSSMKVGKTRWQLEILIDISQYLNVSLDDIVFGKGGKVTEDIREKIIKEKDEEIRKLKQELKKYSIIKREFEKI